MLTTLVYFSHSENSWMIDLGINNQVRISAATVRKLVDLGATVRKD